MRIASHKLASKIWTNGSDKNGHFTIGALHLGKTICSNSFHAKNSSVVKNASPTDGWQHAYCCSNTLPSNGFTHKYAINELINYPYTWVDSLCYDCILYCGSMADPLHELRGLGYSSRFRVSGKDLPLGWRQERRSSKYTVWYDDKGKRYKSSREVELALQDLDYAAAKVNEVQAEHTATDTAKKLRSLNLLQ